MGRRSEKIPPTAWRWPARGAKVLLLTEAREHEDGHGGLYLDDRGLDDWLEPLLGDGVYFLSLKQILQETDFESCRSATARICARPAMCSWPTPLWKTFAGEKIVAAGK